MRSEMRSPEQLAKAEEILKSLPEGAKYEKRVVEYRAFKQTDEYRQLITDLEPRETDEDAEEFGMPEEPTLADLLEQARELLIRS